MARRKNGRRPPNGMLGRRLKRLVPKDPKALKRSVGECAFEAGVAAGVVSLGIRGSMRTVRGNSGKNSFVKSGNCRHEEKIESGTRAVSVPPRAGPTREDVLYAGRDAAAAGGLTGAAITIAYAANVARKKLRGAADKVRGFLERRRLRKSAKNNRARPPEKTRNTEQLLLHDGHSPKNPDVPHLKAREGKKSPAPANERVAAKPRQEQVKFRGFSVKTRRFRSFMNYLEAGKPVFFSELSDRSSETSRWFEGIMADIGNSVHGSNRSKFERNRDAIAMSTLSLIDAVSNHTGNGHIAFQVLWNNVSTTPGSKLFAKAALDTLIHDGMFLVSTHGSRNERKKLAFNTKHGLAGVILAIKK